MKNHNDLSDEALVRASVKNIDYFTTLFERYQDPLLCYIKRISAFKDDYAHEILQDVFLKIWKNLNDFDEKMKFSSWAYRITHNETINAWKKEYKHSSKKYTGELEIDDFSNKDTLISELNKNYEIQKIKSRIQMLEPKYKNVIILRYWEGKDYQEIAEILNKPVATIGTLLHRAKKELQKKFKNEEHENHKDNKKK